MSKDLARPYEGDQPYLFVSYCHKDKQSVLPVLRFLQDEGIRIWYDTGIDPGTEWPEVIADHLDQSSVFLAFISPNSLESHNCRKEFNFAMMKNMPALIVILEPVQFTPVMKLQMASLQAIYYFECQPEEFQDKLLKLPALAFCRDETNRNRTVYRFYLRRKQTDERVRIEHSGFKIGRRPDMCDFALEGNRTVSKVHAVFDLTQGGCSVRDHASLNHTYVNDQMLAEGVSQPLSAGDLVEMGTERFVVEVDEIRETEA